MPLPIKAIEEFKQLLFDQFGIMLNEEEASEQANSFFDLVEDIVPMKEN